MKPEIAHADAKRALYREYYSDVRSMAEDLADRVKAGEIADHDDLTEELESDCDGSEWVLITHRARQVIFVSDNRDYYVEEFGGEGVVKDEALDWTLLSYFAMRQDLWEALEVLGIDHRYDFSAQDEEHAPAA